jgi:hypothetical protein
MMLTSQRMGANTAPGLEGALGTYERLEPNRMCNGVTCSAVSELALWAGRQGIVWRLLHAVVLRVLLCWAVGRRTCAAARDARVLRFHSMLVRKMLPWGWHAACICQAALDCARFAASDLALLQAPVLCGHGRCCESYPAHARMHASHAPHQCTDPCFPSPRSLHLLIAAAAAAPASR